MSIRQASRTYGIFRGTFSNKVNSSHPNPVAAPSVFSPEEGKLLVDGITKCGEWGFPQVDDIITVTPEQVVRVLQKITGRRGHLTFAGLQNSALNSRRPSYLSLN
jgi:hypothetical protein